MGCTSSAPNMVTSSTNTAEKSIQFAEETNEKQLKDADDLIDKEDQRNETNVNGINVLPSCDTLTEPIVSQLVRNNKSLLDMSSLEIEKDVHANGHVVESIESDKVINTPESETTQEDSKSKLEDIVGRVVELNAAGLTVNVLETTSKVTTEKTHDTSDIDYNGTDKAIEYESSDIATENEPESLTGEPLQEAISPSQSESSRATRWEALADIAAELPPSLAVDPLTGQIYALSK